MNKYGYILPFLVRYTVSDRIPDIKKPDYPAEYLVHP
jgi:hypothetical protein